MKKRYLAVYDYGTGGVWLYIYAQTQKDIVDKYPELTVVEEPPTWMGEKEMELISQEMTFDIDKEPSGWLRELIAQR